jgi:mono/diheme cytochrome c family protein
MLSAAAAGAEEMGDASAGFAIAQRDCAECHDVVSRNLNTPKSKAPNFYVTANRKGMSRMALLVWLQSSHPTMPNLILKKQDMADVVAYIVSLKD